MCWNQTSRDPEFKLYAVSGSLTANDYEVAFITQFRWTTELKYPRIAFFELIPYQRILKDSLRPIDRLAKC